MRHARLARVLTVAVLTMGMAGSAAAGPVSRTVSGATPAAIAAVVDQFRGDLGGGNVAGASGSFGGVRREINWDGVPDSKTAPNLLPPDFFNTISPRGVVFSTASVAGTFEVSGNTGVAPVRFADQNATYSSTFQGFSAQRLFANLASTQTTIIFYMPGTTTPATVSGFGAVFTDVDVSSNSYIAYYDQSGNLLTQVNAPSRNRGLSFVGVSFNAGERIGKVVIQAGNKVLSPANTDGAVSGGVTVDVVAMADFLYGEPQALSFISYHNAVSVPFAYRSIQGGGTLLELDDDGAARVSPPFPVLFGDQRFTSIVVGFNGEIRVGPTSEKDTSNPNNTELPVADASGFIAPYWDDLVEAWPFPLCGSHFPSLCLSGISWGVNGTPPNRELIVEWYRVASQTCDIRYLSITFQAVFFENSSDVLINYKNVKFAADTQSCEVGAGSSHLAGDINAGASATIGLQTDPGHFSQYSYNTARLTDGMSLLFTTQPVAFTQAGSGHGTVTTVAGAGGPVQLVAVPDQDSSFAGWSGATDCADGLVTTTGTPPVCIARFVRLPRTGALHLNSDRTDDLFLYNASSGLRFMSFANGNGNFTYSGGVWSPGWLLRAADFNGDGLTDFLTYNVVTGQWFKAINNGVGDFTYVGGLWSSGWMPFVADLNGDGRSDVFVYNPVTGAWVKGFEAGSSGFTYMSGQWSPNWEVYPAMLNADAFADFFLYNAATGQWFLAFNDGGAGFTYRTGTWSPNWTVVPGDYNGDSLTDLFVYDKTSGAAVVCLNTGTTFAYTASALSRDWDLFTGDFNADGRTDLYFYNVATGQFFEGWSNGAGGFQYFGGTWSPNYTTAVLDLNGDGRSDLFVYNETKGGWFQLMNTGPGTFSWGPEQTWDPAWQIVASR